MSNTLNYLINKQFRILKTICTANLMHLSYLKTTVFKSA